MTLQPPDLSEAKRLHAAGMKLVKLKHNSKQPIGNGWNLSHARQIDEDATGYGIPLAPNNLMSIDPDHEAAARAGLAAWGIDYDELLNSGARTVSTRPDSGGRSVFAADPDNKCRWLTINGFDSSGGGVTLLELRAKSANLQDVVPGIVYQGHDGGLYTQQYANEHRLDNPPQLPAQFLQLWREMSLDNDLFRQRVKQFVDAVAAAGVTLPDGSLPTYRAPLGGPDAAGNLSLAFPSKIRVKFNSMNDAREIMERHGYTRHGKGNNERWAHPRATGSPAIRLIAGKSDLWQSDHGGDPLHGTFDAWAAHVQLDHDGDLAAAEAAWLAEGEAAWQEAKAAQVTSEFAAILQTENAEAVPCWINGQTVPAPPAAGFDAIIRPLELCTVPEQLPALITTALTAFAPLQAMERELWVQRIKDAVRNHGFKSGTIDKELQSIIKAQRPAGKFRRFDPYRYIFLAPENKFYDIQSGLSMVPQGLNGRYAAECDSAARHIFEETDPDLTQADALGWNPASIGQPARDQVIYEDEGKRMINTWRGFRLTPMPGDVTPWLQHVEYLIPDERERSVLLDWLATLLQRVNSKPGFAIIHTGTSGNGKDSLYRPISMLMGSPAGEVKISEVTEGWGDHLAQKKFLIITEVKKSRDRDVNNEMKTVTAPTATGKRTLNLKGGRIITQVDCLGVLMMTNFDDGFTIERNDRRYFVITSNVEPKSADYYTQLHEWYDSDNNAAKVMHYLMQRDISGFNHNALPFVTDGARRMADASRYDYEQELAELIEDGVHPFDKGVINTRVLKGYCSASNIGGGARGRSEALKRLGWHPYKAMKKIGGKVEQINFYTPDAEPKNMTPSELHDWYQWKTASDSWSAEVSVTQAPPQPPQPEVSLTQAPPPPPPRQQEDIQK